MEKLRLRASFFVGLLLYAGADICAAQGCDIISPLPSVTSNAYLIQNDSLHTASSSQTQLESIGNQISGPDQVLLLAAASSDRHTVQLPGVPTTLYMVLCGFICFTAVRDRRSWLTFLAGALWLCQTGIAALPELGQLCRSNSTLVFGPSNFEQPRALFLTDPLTDNPRTICYVSLLRKIAAMPLMPETDVCGSLSSKPQNINAQAIVKGFSRPVMPLESSARPADDFLVFSPAFIFSTIARGPPARTIEDI